MEVILGQIGILMVIVLLAALMLFFFRNRVHFARWLEGPRYYAEDDVKLRLQREKENAELELEALEKE